MNEGPVGTRQPLNGNFIKFALGVLGIAAAGGAGTFVQIYGEVQSLKVTVSQLETERSQGARFTQEQAQQLRREVLLECRQGLGDLRDEVEALHPRSYRGN